MEKLNKSQLGNDYSAIQPLGTCLCICFCLIFTEKRHRDLLSGGEASAA